MTTNEETTDHQRVRGLQRGVPDDTFSAPLLFCQLQAGTRPPAEAASEEQEPPPHVGLLALRGAFARGQTPEAVRTGA